MYLSGVWSQSDDFQGCSRGLTSKAFSQTKFTVIKLVNSVENSGELADMDFADVARLPLHAAATSVPSKRELGTRARGNVALVALIHTSFFF